MLFNQYIYTSSFYSLILIGIIALFDVCVKLNNHVLQCSDIKCTYEIKPLQIEFHILQSSNVFFEGAIGFFDNIFALNHVLK